MPKADFGSLDVKGNFFYDSGNPRYHGAVGDGVADDRQAFVLADAALGRVRVTPGFYLVGTNLTIVSHVEPEEGAVFKPGSGVNIHFAGGFTGTLRQYFDLSLGGTVTFSASQTVPPSPQWWGAVGDGVTNDYAALNAAMAAAVAGGGVMLIPEATYAFGTGLTIDDGIRVVGMGGPTGKDGVFAGSPRTKLKYTGASGVAITVVGSAAQGLMNVHLENFLLEGNVNADGGILFGSGVNTGHCSIKDVTVRNFLKTGAYGFKFKKCLTSVFENLIAVNCYDGFKFDTDSVVTSLTFIDCHGYTCARNALRWMQGANLGTCTFIKFVSESSDAEGVFLDGCQNCNFYDLYSEDNCRLSGTAPVKIVGSGATPSRLINFYSPYIQDAVGGVCSFALEDADFCTFYNPIVFTPNAGWITCTSATTSCTVFMAFPVFPDTVTGNAPGRVIIQTPISTYRMAVTLTAGGENGLVFFLGVCMVTDVTHNRSAIYGINGTANSVTLLAGDTAFWAATSTASRYCIINDAGTLRFRNNLADTTTVIVAVLNAAGMQ